MDKKTVLVTGSSGFIGGRLLEWLRAAYPQAKVIGTVKQEANEAGQIAIDLVQQTQVKEMLERIRPDYIFHLAGRLYANSWRDLYEGNVVTTVNLLEIIKELGLDTKVVLIGSAAEYGSVSPARLPLTEENRPEPTSLYGASKACQTALMHYYSSQGVQVFMVRLFNVYGKGMPDNLAVGSFLRQIMRIKSGETPPVLVTGNLNSRRDYLYVDDVCSALAALAASAKGGEIYQICSGCSVAMGEILAKLIEIAGIQIEVTNDPTRNKKIDVPDIYGSYAKTNAVTGWVPTVSLEKGLALLFD
jgi:GDP-4-dehydro-6-deoxy-D-mannose reductase